MSFIFQIAGFSFFIFSSSLKTVELGPMNLDL